MVGIEYVAVRLFGRSVGLAVFSLAVYVILAYWIPHNFHANPIFTPLARLAEQYAGGVALVMLGCAFFSALISGYWYWQWMSGETPSCPRCGMMMKQRTGHRGFFWGCIRYPACRGTQD